MLEDKVVYKIYIVLKDNKCDIYEIRAVAKIYDINYIASKKITNKNLVAQREAYEIRYILRRLIQCDVNFSIEPPYPYDYNKG